ncbi:MAG: nucleotidyltransferase domain-containing protein [Candidatus Gastranaerophilales bacterium]|nr:nucleotidyltransferase domain-containing protein [Candidatus Gastranaerophilales bacterium]
MEFGLTGKTITILKNFFSKFNEIEEVKIYGSRAKGNYRKGSDIDFALYGNIDFRLLSKINGEIDELPTPYKYDITDYKTIENQDLKEHIDRVGKTFYVRAKQ